MPLQPGAEFGQYRIIGLLGVGGMARVYHARQAVPRREVALKVISPELAINPEFRARFEREANALARLEHPNILPIYETGTIDGQPYICYRLVRGGTMRDLIGPPWSVNQVTALLAPVADALDYAHSQGVIHRDIKPSNILLTTPNDQGARSPIVADFGLARIVEPVLEDGSTHTMDSGDRSLTQANVGLGTPAYMAPEQVLSRPLTPQTDQYALAITAYQALTGTVPFSANTPLEVAFMQVNTPLPPPSEHNAALTPAVDAVLRRAMSKEPWDRYPSCNEFIRTLATTMQGLATPQDTTIPLAAGFVPRPGSATPASATFGTSFTPIPRPTAAPPPTPSPAPSLQPQPASGGSGGRIAIVVAVVALLVVVGAAGAVYAARSGGGGSNKNNSGNNLVANKSVNNSATTNGAANSSVVVPTRAPDPTQTVPPSSTTVRPTEAPTRTSAGFVDGVGAGARFDGPSDITFDTAGNLYIADTNNNRVRKLAMNGSVVTFAGDGKPGLQNGPGQSAEFNTPTCIAADAAGNIYVGDDGNHVIRKIAPNGTVSTLAGSPTAGFQDGAPGVARFGTINSLTVDGKGDVYVADAKNNRIRMVAPNGNVISVAGTGANGFADGQANKAEFSSPYGLTIDRAGTLYVADGGNNRIRKITNTGQVTTITGSGDSGYADGAPNVAEFQTPAAITIDSNGILYVADSDNFRIREIAPDGTVTTLAGTGTDGYADGPVTDAVFGATEGLTVGFGALYVCDYENNSIRRVTPDGTVTTVAGPPPRGN